jgi:hypothetical protein
MAGEKLVIEVDGLILEARSKSLPSAAYITGL